MCTHSTAPAKKDPAKVMKGTFMVIKGIKTADLHIAGTYDTVTEAQARQESLGTAAIAFIPCKAMGDCSHTSGRHVAEVPVSAPTVPVLVLSNEF